LFSSNVWYENCTVINVNISYGTKWQVWYETVNVKNVMVRNRNMAWYEIAKSWYEMVFLDTKWTWYETTIILHVYGRNMFITTRNLQIRVHVYRPRHYCGN
jgi:hypothetical protein